MIVYDTKNWINTIYLIFFSYNKAFTTRILFLNVLLVMAYTALSTYIMLDVLHWKVQLNLVSFSLIGVILSLVLVFRLNSAYSKWWEGRKKWGSLINHSRSLAAYVQSVLPKEDFETRHYFAVQIANFASALEGRLREKMRFDEFENIGEDYLTKLKKADHVPNKIATQILQKTQELYKAGVITDFDKMGIREEVEDLIDILGACERIKNTPIPFSHSSFIKSFILTYMFVMPFGYMQDLGYITIPIVGLIAYALLGVEIISEEIENPFGFEANDLPLIHLANLIKRNVFEILESEYQTEEKAEKKLGVIPNIPSNVKILY